jgi:hypothetical protein
VRYLRIQISLILVFVFVVISTGIEAVDSTTAFTLSDISIDDLIVQAAQQKSTKEGENYWWQVFEKLDNLSDDQLTPCIDGKSDPKKKYKYVLEINEDGAMEKVHWELVDGFTECIDKVLMEIKVQRPPESPFYFYLSEI